MSAPSYSVAAWNVEYLLRYAAGRGLVRREMLFRFALDEAALEDVDGRVPLATYLRMWEELPALASDPDMALHVVQYATEMEAPLSALLFLASPTLGDGFRRLERWQRVTFDLGDTPATELREEGEVTSLTFHHERSPMFTPTAAVVDSCLGLVTMAHMATQRPVVPLGVAFRHPRPVRPADYEAAFGARVAFEQERDSLRFRTADLSLPHPDASRTLLAIVEQHANGVLIDIESRSAGASEDELLQRLRRAIVARLPEGGGDLSGLAAELGIGERSLQRRLREQGTTLRELQDQERRAVALHYVQSPRAALTDIAFLLGFSEPSAFTRAFTRWTGRSPSDYRRAVFSGESF